MFFTRGDGNDPGITPRMICTPGGGIKCGPVGPRDRGTHLYMNKRMDVPPLTESDSDSEEDKKIEVTRVMRLSLFHIRASVCSAKKEYNKLFMRKNYRKLL